MLRRVGLVSVCSSIARLNNDEGIYVQCALVIYTQIFMILFALDFKGREAPPDRGSRRERAVRTSSRPAFRRCNLGPGRRPFAGATSPHLPLPSVVIRPVRDGGHTPPLVWNDTNPPSPAAARQGIHDGCSGESHTYVALLSKVDSSFARVRCWGYLFHHFRFKNHLQTSVQKQHNLLSLVRHRRKDGHETCPFMDL